MSPLRRLLLSLTVVAAASGAACGDPPDKEMQQAQGAIDAAKAAGADLYAHDEFTAAQDALKRAHEAVDQRDYRLALNNALDASERAQTAAKDTVNQKATARADAEKALADASVALNESHAKLKAVEATRPLPKSVVAARRSVGNDEIAVQEARAAFKRGDYLVAIDKARAAATSLRAASGEVEAATGRRRR